MSAANRSRAIAHVIESEGGYVDHPDDPGGATKYGITRRTLARWRGVNPWWALPKKDVRNLQRTEAAGIYALRYWQTVGADVLPSGLDLAVFDFAVNSGPSRAVASLQGLVGAQVDGKVGPQTHQRIEAYIARFGTDALINAYVADRLKFLKSLENFKIFGRGWQDRLKRVEVDALRWAADSHQSTTSRKVRNSPMDILSGYRTYIVAAAMLVAGVAQATGVDLPGFDGQNAVHLITEALAIIFLRRGVERSSRA